MAGKNIEGQMDIFELFRQEKTGEQEKGLPEIQDTKEESGTTEYADEAEQEVVFEPPVLENVVMEHACGDAMVAYMDYCRVYIRQKDTKAEVRRFRTTKDAVDFYVQQMQKISEETNT
jgi:hypothetical protein